MILTLLLRGDWRKFAGNGLILAQSWLAMAAALNKAEALLIVS